MKTAVRPRIESVLLALLVLLVVFTLVLLVVRPRSAEEEVRETPDPHEGQVYIYDGNGWVWMTPLEGVPVNAFSKEEFQMMGERPIYLGSQYDTILGVDVSEHQHEIDWKQVKEAGVDFAYIRLGRRGYTEGGLFNDPWFEKNYEGAKENAILVGVYFYSQAISEAEAREEAEFLLGRLEGRELDLPVVYDWELIDNEDADIARTKDLDMETRTDCALAFCKTVTGAGYQASVYFNRILGYYGYDLSRLTDYPFWFALPVAPPELCWPSFYYKVDVWQYSFSETVPGIEGETDMNMLFIPLEPETPEPTEESSPAPN
jgi:GH25 family lysozyme M1 (1,4-beta-N-acetylmuramidase)